MANYPVPVRLTDHNDILLRFLRSREYTPGATCSVKGCTVRARYEVLLYDFYSEVDEQFLQTDFTCPFLCETHFQHNEAGRVGERRPRAVVRYPCTNREHAQGFSRYIPIDPVPRSTLSERMPAMPDKPLIQFTGQEAFTDEYGGTKYAPPTLIFINPAEMDYYTFADERPASDTRPGRSAYGELRMRSEAVFRVEGDEARKLAALLAEFALSTTA